MSPIVSGLASVASMLFNAASSAKPVSGQAKPDRAPAPEPSSIVTLSQDASALARLADQGVLTASTATDARSGAVTGRGAAGVAAGAALQASGANRAVSKEDFQALLTRFGATDAQKEQLTAGFDSDKDGSITRDEFLKGVAQTVGPQSGGEFAQSLLQLMDRGAGGNADGSVGAGEFGAFSTAFATVSQRFRTAA
ncbi:hypothetical protein [Acidovorax sp. NCPPB 4044]|uniref:hypothetical protein n=1 Tax=Acidovorax sp. NCPPB 4044 TaxID=2940490 RepID=UPI002303738C|nr:hypothetical protein [Acidovorax sp. NCPPB 4044]MDA8521095.1 hypothetical protein [Acidovorax sp. NCPPB 4044]